MTTIINKQIKPTQILKNLVDGNKSGSLQVRVNSVTWEIVLVNGKLQWAYHSLQSLETIKHCLLSLQQQVTAKSLSQLNQANLDSYTSVVSLINQLVEQNYLTVIQRKVLLKEVSQDAMEFFLWLTEVTEKEYQWKPNNSIVSSTNQENLLDIPSLFRLLTNRLQGWQKLSPLVQSPYQRPICLDPSLLKKNVPSGNLSPDVLEKLAKLMRGATIREIGIFLKQNDLRVAQLLSPYIQHKVITLYSAKSPLDKLPQIPSLSSESSSSTTRVKSATNLNNSLASSKPANSPVVASRVEPANPSKPITQVQSPQKIYKIVSIDDSPTMLDTIKNYLGTEKYQVSTLENPMLSLGMMFDIKPDLILMDFSMPGINGNKLCGILRKSPFFKTTPIIMVTGNLKMFDEDKLQISGITDYLAKPFTREDLLAIVDQYLRD